MRGARANETTGGLAEREFGVGPPTDASSDNGRRFRSAARKGDARAPQDTSPSEALASKQVHMAMYRWPIFAAMVVVAGDLLQG